MTITNLQNAVVILWNIFLIFVLLALIVSITRVILENIDMYAKKKKLIKEFIKKLNEEITENTQNNQEK